MCIFIGFVIYPLETSFQGYIGEKESTVNRLTNLKVYNAWAMFAWKGLRSCGTITIFYNKLVDDDKLAWSNEDRKMFFAFCIIIAIDLSVPDLFIANQSLIIKEY